MECSQVVIVGSGPSAVSAATALVRRGAKVTMLDAGRTLDAERLARVDRLAATEPEHWDPRDRELIREGLKASAAGVPLKRLYGSDFAFDTSGSGASLDLRDAAVQPSFARAGFSNVWGAGILPFDAAALEGWPFGTAQLDEGYRQATALLRPEPLVPSRQGEAFLGDAARSAAALKEAGIGVTPGSLAVDGSKCRRCGLCLHGCPYRLIYNSESTLEDLLRAPGFQYWPGFVVDRLRETDGEVQIEGHDLSSGQGRAASAKRVLLGAGVISSTAILLRSLGELRRPIRLADSFYYLLPLLRFKSTPGVETEALHTLAQAFVSLRSNEIGRHAVHFTIYGYNDLMRAALESATMSLPVPNAIVSRTLVAGGYLHSDLSPGLYLSVDERRIQIEGEDTSAAVAMARKAAGHLRKHARHLRTLPLTFAMRFLPPGRGYHAGASFPMRKAPGHHESDLYGRPSGFKYVHLIDASCLPSIPAGPVTLSVMANAWRIASGV